MSDQQEVERSPARRAAGVVGLGAAACAACCAGPILAFLGGLSIVAALLVWSLSASVTF